MSPLSSSLFERLRCAACRSALARGGPASRAPRDAPRCAPARPTFSARHTLVCGRCDARYPVVRDVPILLDGSKSLFDAGDCVAQVSGGRPAPTWKELARDEMERLVRPAGKNLAARPMIERLAAELRAESDSPRVLVIGGATLGIGMSALTSDPAFQLAESDVTIGPRTNVVLDACEIPFEDGTFDAVVAQAVFEYFPDPFRVAAEIHRVLRLVGEARAAILQLGDPRLRIGRRRPLPVRQPLALPLAVEPDQVLGRRRRDAALLRQSLEHRAVALAAVAPHDHPQGSVGLHGRGVDPDPPALDEAVFGQALEHPDEDRLMDLEWQPGAGLAQPRMVRHRLRGA